MKDIKYEQLCKRILTEGHMIPNERTGKGCLTVINENFTYHVDEGRFPLVTTRKVPWKAAIAEFLGYIRGYSNAEDFAKLGAPTWKANANENQSWLNNPHRKGQDDMGRVYGVQGRGWRTPEWYNYEKELSNLQDYFKPSYSEIEKEYHNRSIDQLKKIYNNLKQGKDDRGEIITFWNPGEFHMGCLRPCMHTHQFSLLDGTLYLNSYQRSIDVPLGLCFNMPQVYFFLAIMAQITGNKPGKAYHNLVNCHLYEDQIDLMKEQVQRIPYNEPKLIINPDIKTLEDLETWVTLDDFKLEGYQAHDAIKYPFSV